MANTTAVDGVQYASDPATGSPSLQLTVGLQVGHVTSTGAIASAVAGAQAGTTPPAPVSTGATDTRGTITFGTGTTPAAGAQVVVTFGTAFGAAPIVSLTPGNAATQALGLYVASPGTTAFTISVANPPAASQANTVYSVNYMVIG